MPGRPWRSTAEAFRLAGRGLPLSCVDRLPLSAVPPWAELVSRMDAQGFFALPAAVGGMQRLAAFIKGKNAVQIAEAACTAWRRVRTVRAAGRQWMHPAGVAQQGAGTEAEIACAKWFTLRKLGVPAGCLSVLLWPDAATFDDRAALCVAIGNSRLLSDASGKTRTAPAGAEAAARMGLTETACLSFFRPGICLEEAANLASVMERSLEASARAVLRRRERMRLRKAAGSAPSYLR